MASNKLLSLIGCKLDSKFLPLNLFGIFMPFSALSI